MRYQVKQRLFKNRSHFYGTLRICIGRRTCFGSTLMKRVFHFDLSSRSCADRSGSAAVEFSIVALPFLGICAGIFQVLFVIWAAQNFEQSVQIAVRSLFTGQFQLKTAGQTNSAELLAKLREQICGAKSTNIVTLYDCSSLKIDVSLSSSFSGSNPASPIDAASRDWNSSFGTNYSCPKPGSIVIVTAAAKMPTFFGLLGVDLKSFADGSHLLLSTAVFRTEPYQTDGTSACSS